MDDIIAKIEVIVYIQLNIQADIAYILYYKE